MEKAQMKNLKLNYHMLEGCNYNCKFCFAHYDKKQKLDYEHMKSVIRNTALCGFFSGINFAGGEPFLIPEIIDLIQFAKEQGLSTSVITNGSLITKEKLDIMLPYLDCIGISVHSICDRTKIATGSCTNKDEVLKNEQLQDICGYIRTKSNCKIKINTVVNSLNKHEVFVPFIKTLSVDRWKILRCQEFENNTSMLISDSEWDEFCLRNKGIPNTVFEDNMKDTYIMVNPSGLLMAENSEGNSYKTIGSVLKQDMESLLLKHPLHIQEYLKRYSA